VRKSLALSASSRYTSNLFDQLTANRKA
jgi:hypothetical protein